VTQFSAIVGLGHTCIIKVYLSFRLCAKKLGWVQLKIFDSPRICPLERKLEMGETEMGEISCIQ